MCGWIFVGALSVHLDTFDWASSFPPDSSASRDKQERVIVPVAVDSTQQEAVMVLERLKVCF